MTLDGFLTFLTLVIAVFALASPVARLRAKLVFVVQIPLAMFSLILVLYLEFFEMFGQPCPSVLGNACDWFVIAVDSSLSPSDIAFIVVLVWMIFAMVIHKYVPRLLASILLTRIAQLVDQLAYERKYFELIGFIEPYLPVIGKAWHRHLCLQRCHDTLEAMQGGIMTLRQTMFDEEARSRESQRSRFAKFARRWVGNLAVLIPSQNRAQSSAADIGRVFFQSEDLKNYIAVNRPYFAIPLVYQDMFGSREYCESYFEMLITNTGSILYEEIQHNQNSSYQHGYEFPETNRLLHFLFADAQTAFKLEIWKPVGNHMLKLLNPSKSPDFSDYLKGSAVDFDEECWRNGVFVGITFFNLMVTAAAYQGVTWHMWMYYMTSVIEKLEQGYDASDPSVDTSDEFPTRSARLVYEIMYALCSWTKLVSHVPEDSPHRKVSHNDNGHIQDWDTWSLPNNNIPMSAAVVLGTCLATILMSRRFENRFVVQMYEVALRTVNELNDSGDEGQLRRFLILSIIHGGQKDLGRDYGELLRSMMNEVDHFIRYEVRDFETILNQTHPGSSPEK